MFLAGFAASSPLVYSAASTVARKAFDAVATRSLRGISDVVSAHYKGDKEVLRLRDELELKVRIMALPVDICVQHAVKGNSALQGVLDVALSILRDIEEFEEALSQQDVASGRGEGGTPSRESHTVVAKKLETLIRQLDSVQPYLGMAISSVSLLDAGQGGYSPSRLMAASHCLRSAPRAPGSAVLRLAAATWHQEIQAKAGGQQRLMQTKFPLCSLAVVRQQGRLPGPEGSGQATPHAGSSYDLLVTQDLDDGLYHEADEQPGALRIPVQELAHIGWATSHTMKLGGNDFTPALVLTLASGPGELQAAASSASSACSTRALARRMSFSTDRKPPAAAPPQTAQPCQRYALQLRRPPDPDSDTEEAAAAEEACSATKATPSARREAKGTGAAAASSSRAGAGELTSDWGTLGELEYVLRLCMLEAREELPHYMVKDERIAMALAGVDAAPPAGRTASQLPLGGVSTPSAAEVDSLARNFDQVGFGSPLC